MLGESGSSPGVREGALERPEHREAATQRFLADVEGMVKGADEGGFDVDEVADEGLDAPDFPEPALTLIDLDNALNHLETLPPGTEMARLDPGSYKLRLPGGEAWVRVTTDAEVFEDHAESHEFLSPGGALFDGLATPKSEASSVPPRGPETLLVRRTRRRCEDVRDVRSDSGGPDFGRVAG
jgi:hypothetical protein